MADFGDESVGDTLRGDVSWIDLSGRRSMLSGIRDVWCSGMCEMQQEYMRDTAHDTH